MLQNLSDYAPITMLNESRETVKFDNNKAFKTLLVTNTLDKSEDFFVNDKIMNLVGESLREFRNKMMNEPLPKPVNLLINSIIPQKGIKKGKVVKVVKYLTVKKQIKVSVLERKMAKKRMLMQKP